MRPDEFDPVAQPGSQVEAILQAIDVEVAQMRLAFDRIPRDTANLEWVKQKLAHMAAIDQFMRRKIDDLDSLEFTEDERNKFWAGFSPRWQSIDSSNQNELKDLLKRFEWFKISEFGKEAADAAWLVAQHADRDVQFQKHVLMILEKLLPLGEASGPNFAYLYDRVAVAENRPQRFGTQGRCVGLGHWEPWPSEDPRNLQARRDLLGLGSLEENIRRVSKLCRGTTD